MILKKIFFAIILSTQVMSASLSPKYWPLEAQLTHDVTIDGQPFLENGTKFTLLRVEGEQLLGTFGREGTHWVDVVDTDVAELASGIAAGTIAKKEPNLIERLYTTLYKRTEDGVNQPLRIGDLRSTEYIIFYFAYGGNENHAKTIDLLSEHYSAFREIVPNCELIMIQCDALAFKNSKANHIRWPFMALHLSYAYKDALHLDQVEGKPSFVLVGSNGNILKRLTTETSVFDVFSKVSDCIENLK